jgi:hypothetical protein
MLNDGLLTQIISNEYKLLDSRIKEIIKIPGVTNKIHLKERFNPDEIISQGLSYKGLLKLEILLRGLPNSLLLPGRRMSRRLEKLEKAHDEFPFRKRMTKNALYRVFSVMGTAAIDYIVLNNQIRYLDDLDNFLKIDKCPLLSTDEIMAITGLPESSDLGLVIEDLKKAIFLNKIKSKRGAIRFLEKR